MLRDELLTCIGKVLGQAVLDLRYLLQLLLYLLILFSINVHQQCPKRHDLVYACVQLIDQAVLVSVACELLAPREL